MSLTTPCSPATLTRDVVVAAAAYTDSWLGLQQRLLRVPGVQAAIWFDGELVLSSAHGVADVQSQAPLTTRHLFRIASHSKTFTATAVLQLVQAGRLRLDDAAAAWLPFLAGSPLGEATVRELVAHTSGATRDGESADHWQLGAPFPDADELRRVAVQEGAVLARNERFKYSNTAYSLLGLVIEAVSGTTYADYVRESIVDRLGLADTGPELDPSRLHEHATGHSALSYADHRLPIEHVDTAAMAAATGFYGTAADIACYAAAHLPGDERLLDDGTKRIMQRTESEVGGGTTGQYALGLDVTDLGGRRLLGHGGGYPGHITRTLFDPAARLAVSVFTNAIDGPALPLAHGVLRVLDLAARTAAAVDLPVDLAVAPGSASAVDPGIDLDGFTGRFANLWGVLDVVRFGDRLVTLCPAALDPTETVTQLTVEDATTLRIADDSGYGAPGERFRYHRDDAGAVRTVHGGGGMTLFPLKAFSTAVATRNRFDLAGGGALI